jgi:branched-chain amino acid transport system ATP-binding protein
MMPAATTEALLEVKGLGKRFGGFVALEGIDLTIAKGERLGLIGPNGSGKSTLVNCLCGTLQNESGTVTFAGRSLDGLIAHERTRLGLARSFQLPKPFHSLNLIDNIRIPLLYAVNARHGQPHLRGAAIVERCEELLSHVNLIEKARRRPRDLTQVEMRPVRWRLSRLCCSPTRRWPGCRIPRSKRSSRCCCASTKRASPSSSSSTSWPR